jgi:hypothetical protein
MMTVYDRDWFKATLIEAGVAIDGTAGEQIDAWDARFHKLWWDHRGRRGKKSPGGGAAPSKALLAVNAALFEWLGPPEEYSYQITTEQAQIHQFDPVKMEAMLWLRDATTDAIKRLKDQRKGVREETVNTRLFLELYWFYTDVTGAKKLSDTGPAFRFITTFSEKMDELAVFKKTRLADLIRKANARPRGQLYSVAEPNAGPKMTTAFPLRREKN